MVKQSQATQTPKGGRGQKKQLLIVVGHEKGGVGKSLIAANLAVACAMQGMDTVLVDTDTTKTTTHWGKLRQEMGRKPEVMVVESVVNPVPTVRDLVTRFDVTVVDIGARDYEKLLQLAALCHLWIMPTSVGREDLESTVRIQRTMEQIGVRRADGRVPLVCVFNRVPSRSKEVDVSREDLLAACPDLVIAKGVMRDTRVYRDASREGATVFEMPGRRNNEVEQFRDVFVEVMQHIATSKPTPPMLPAPGPSATSATSQTRKLTA